MAINDLTEEELKKLDEIWSYYNTPQQETKREEVKENKIVWKHYNVITLDYYLSNK